MLDIIDILNIYKQYSKPKYDNLVYYLQVVFNKFKDNYHPYHNFEHTIHVIQNAWVINYLYLKEFDLDDFYIVHYSYDLIVASIFHDVLHSGGKYSDNININNAIKIYKEYNKDEALRVGIIIDYIRATEFPYISDYTENTPKWIIRAADLNCFYTQTPSHLLGLMFENNQTITEYLDMQRKFPNFLDKYSNNKIRTNLIDNMPNLNYYKLTELLKLLDNESKHTING